jgi:hypothetical protein
MINNLAESIKSLEEANFKRERFQIENRINRDIAEKLSSKNAKKIKEINSLESL